MIGYNSETVMDIRESVISSFFFHLILFLLMLAAANYTAGIAISNRNILMLNLAMPDNREQTVPADLPEKPPLEPDSLPDDNSQSSMSLPELSAVPPAKQPEAAVEPVKKAESPVAPARTEPVEQNPIRTEGFTSPDAYYEFIILHKKIFRKQAELRVNELLGEAFKVNTREFYGGTGVVNLRFGTDRKLKSVTVDSESPALKSFLEEIIWETIPPPAAFSLGNTAVQIEFAVHEGYMSIKINTL